MATNTPTMRCAAVEAPTLATSPLSFAFTDLLSALDQHIACERDLDDVCLFDPAYRSWLDDAEAAQMRLYEALARTTGLATDCQTDVPLRRMSLLIATLLREGTAEGFRRYVQFEADFVHHLVVPCDGLEAARTRQMLTAAREKLHHLARLSLYRQDGDLDPEAGQLCTLAA